MPLCNEEYSMIHESNLYSAGTHLVITDIFCNRNIMTTRLKILKQSKNGPLRFTTKKHKLIMNFTFSDLFFKF